MNIGAARRRASVDRGRASAYLNGMSIRPLVILPDSRLRLISDPVVRVDARVRAIVEDMFETMYDAPGIGLAAIQVGVPERIVTIDVGPREAEDREEGDEREVEKRPLALINPEVVSASEELSVYAEGCLSIPEYYADVERPARVRVRYMDLNGETREIDADGLLATCVQHEIDHLNGVLFIDHISKLKRDRVMTKFTKLAKKERDGV
ncbi:Peptide deformylase 1 [Starkeya nomas]|uniref:Peptide deformylase n=2 Tax=Starkeya nomas TaxID=2666134 RepID=A0A5S9Q926_9HYPH|nr:Peptide deformylase 1 [Starkeya nomas]